MSLQRFIQRRGRSVPGGPPLVQINPAPESALPLMPFAGVTPEAEVEFRALLTRVPADRGAPPALLSVHTLSGRLEQRLEGRLGPAGEYQLEFVPRLSADRRRFVLARFRFAPAPGAGGAPRESEGAAGPDIELEMEMSRRIDPPMEPEEGGSLVLQISGRLSGRREGDQ